jgi:hypothetical protein
MSKKRTIINYRKIGDQVNPENMTHKEYINYLCYKFGFRISTGWDGVEKRHYRANWSEDKSYNIKTRDEALEFLGISKVPEAPDGINKRQSDRRIGQKDYRKNKPERRSNLLNSRRKEDLLALRTHRLLMSLSLCFIALYGFAVFLYNFVGGSN